MPVICPPTYSIDKLPIYSEYFDRFDFPLSDFQKHAIEAIVDGYHILVCAPTGSGKTLPAEFAIQHFISQGKKVIYTSPIKALSNQKYHDFSQKFPHISVGLCTGDIKTNPTADLIIMTAEILNNRLFLNSSDHVENDTSSSTADIQSNLFFQMDINTELAAVIMDEVHYINDTDRGHVWEQTILTLPPHIQMIMLSATLDGPEKFAEWIESTRPDSKVIGTDKQVYLSQTRTRIVPLSHYVYFPKAPESLIKATKTTPLEPILDTLKTSGNLIQIQTHQNVFQPVGYNNMSRIMDTWEKNIVLPPNRKYLLNSLASYMKGSDDPDKDDSMLPAIVFIFSRKLVEDCANDITANILPFDSKIPYNAARECEQIIRKLPNWREYMELPEYRNLVKLLEKGIGIHHSGMIPVLREIVELMISQKKIMMLFATESFAIGLDCPIRTAVFTSLTKYDGSTDRFLYAHEYTQMAGRAGRRGIDTVGHVIHLPQLFRNRNLPSMESYREILSGTPQKLVSKFHIDYGMVLSLLKKGVCCDFHLFAERSMVKSTILKEVDARKVYLDKTTDLLAEKQKAMNYLRTSLSVCREYLELKKLCVSSVNKKRKELERKLTALRQQYRYLEEDADLVVRTETIQHQVEKEMRELRETEKYVETQTEMVCRVMKTRGYISRKDADLWELTPKGEMASHLAEVHPLPLTHIIHQTGWFAGFTPIEIVGVLAAFVDARIKSQQQQSGETVEPKSSVPKVLEAIRRLNDEYREIEQIEMSDGMHTGIRYRDALCFDFTDIFMEWCRFDEEIVCKAFLQNLEGVGVGDFIKACMKISALSKEIAGMCQLAGKGNAEALELEHKLSQVDGLVLKYVATTQSLYL